MHDFAGSDFNMNGSSPGLGARALPQVVRACTVACLAALAGNTAAQVLTTSAAAASDNAIVVTGARLPQRMDQALADITVLGRADIEAATGRTLAELLAQQSGLQFWNNGGPGKASSVSIRGLEARHSLLMIDGVRYGSATLGIPPFENLALESIDRIEIVRGPMAALYGSDAVGGVIQIFTRRGAQGLRAQAQVGIGSNGWRQAGGNLRLGSGAGPGAWDAALSLDTQRTRAFSATNAAEPFGSYDPDRDGFRQQSFTAQAGLALPGGWRVEAQGQHTQGTTHYDDGIGADSRAGLLTQVVSMQAAGVVRGSWRSSLRLSRSVDELDTQVSASPWTELGVIGTVQQQLTWENTVDTGMGRVLLLAEHLRQDVKKPADPFEVSSRSISGLALGLNGSAGVHHWQAALRRDHNSQFGNPTTGSAAYGFDLSTQLRLGASLANSFIAPSFNQLYYPLYGNPDLLPEKGVHKEVSLRWLQAGQEVRMAYFDNRIRGYISSGARPANIPRTTIEGLTLAWSLQQEDWTLSASADLIDARNSTTGSPDYGQALPRRAKDSLRLSADRRLGAWSLGASLHNVGSRPDFDGNFQRIELPGYTIADLRADLVISPDWRLQLRLNNLANVQYQTVLGYNQPGREWLLSLRYGSL